jgi:hypothetical protein
MKIKFLIITLILLALTGCENIAKELLNIKDGKDGLRGPTGNVGLQGSKGDPGLNGKDGKDGLRGPTGNVGLQGSKGDPGLNGKDGENYTIIFPTQNTMSSTVTKNESGSLTSVVSKMSLIFNVDFTKEVRDTTGGHRLDNRYSTNTGDGQVFNGFSQHIRVNEHSDLFEFKEKYYIIEITFKTFDGDFILFNTKSTGTGYSSKGIEIGCSNGEMWYNENLISLKTNKKINDGVKHVVKIEKISYDINFYIDDILCATKIGGIVDVSNKINIGSSNDNANMLTYFNGTITSIAVWSQSSSLCSSKINNENNSEEQNSLNKFDDNEILVIECPSSRLIWVNGYFRKNGTYVKGHWRTKPDGVKENNLSYKG